MRRESDGRLVGRARSGDRPAVERFRADGDGDVPAVRGEGRNVMLVCLPRAASRGRRPARAGPVSIAVGPDGTTAVAWALAPAGAPRRLMLSIARGAP